MENIMFMSDKLFGKNIDPACEYCEYGKGAPSNMVACPKYGVVAPFYYCRKFKYNPLKRIPKKANCNLPKFSADDFSL